MNSVSSVAAVDRTVSALAPREPRVQHQDLGKQSLYEADTVLSAVTAGGQHLGCLGATACIFRTAG